MFKIKGEKKVYFLKIGSEIQVYDTLARLWSTYIITNLKFDKGDVHYFGKPQFSKQINEDYLCRESNIPEHIEQNLLRVMKR